MNDTKKKFIAILGFVKIRLAKNIVVTRYVSAELARQKMGVCCGNVSGTFYHAFMGAKSAHGATKLILEKGINIQFSNLHDTTIITSNRVNKHYELANTCLGAIVIGGGNGTIEVIDFFLQLSRPVIAINNSGGIVPNELDSRVELIDDYRLVVNTIISKLIMN